MSDKPLPPNTLKIQMYLHCRRCLAELPDGHSPETWARLSVGLTDIGLQVWCVRHDINVVHLDFEGRDLPANNSAPAH